MAKKSVGKKAAQKYLVTGACGFTGSHICDLLRERGLDYRATDLERADRKYLPHDAEFVPSDLTDPSSLDAVVDGIDVILHPAAIFDWSTPMDVLEAVNARGTENLCEAALRAGAKRLVSWSTSGVYGSQQVDDLPIREDHPKAPIDDYSKSKMEQDRIALSYNGRGKLTTSILRPGIVYGPRAQYGAMQVFDAFGALPVAFYPANFHYRFGTVHVRDIAGAAIFIAGKEEAAGETYCVVDSSDITIPEFLKLVAAALGKPAIPLYLPPMLTKRAGLFAASVSEWIAHNITKTHPLLERGPLEIFPVDLYISNQKLRDLGYVFEYPRPQRGVEEVVAWMREEGLLDGNPINLIRRMSGRTSMN